MLGLRGSQIAKRLTVRRTGGRARPRPNSWLDRPPGIRSAHWDALIVEVKTRLDDLGAIERQLGWYERQAIRAANDLGWEPRQVRVWLLFLASEEVDIAVRANRHILETAFPARAREMLASLDGNASSVRRGLALIDPTSRRRDWLLRTRVDGRRSAAPFRDYADAAARMGR